ncbi:conserved hypothetical protein [Xanthomonas phaseoli pv. phaseoli]|uniref:N-acetyltransferase domain-containing protein n=2 Tax=Xanthomonas TaxID=338 RepID=A0ABY1TSB3_XANCH|nr:conserved hypothetical protein [Xanthomonas phaseoli pv. phaseoli]
MQAARSEGPQQSASVEKEASPCGRDSEAKVPFRGPTLIVMKRIETHTRLQLRLEWTGGQRPFSANALIGQCSENLVFARCVCGPIACLRQTGSMDTIRNYRPHDFAACMTVFDGNVPAFFSAEERPNFVQFLTHHAAAWHYQVIERAGEAIAGAGYSISADGTTAGLCWGMVHPKLHRQGLGTMLLLARLEALCLMPNIRQVVLDTSQHTQAFYARFGFVVKQVVSDGYGAGLDRWDMALDLETLA